MNRSTALLLIVLGLAFTLFAQAPAGQAPAGQQQKKQITDPEEYKVYVAAIGEADAKKKVQMLDDFLKKYPSSVVKEDALDLKMRTQAQYSLADAAATAHQLLQVDPNNMFAFYIIGNNFIQMPPSKADPQLQQKLAGAEQAAQRGLQVLPSFTLPNVKPEDLKTAKDAFASVFRQTLGIVALAREQWEAAENQFHDAAEAAPQDASVFYRLGNAYISERPTPKYSQALWAFARAVTIEGPTALSPAGRNDINKYLTSTYVKYHGSEEGLDSTTDKPNPDALKVRAKAQPFPPADFHVKSKAEIEAEKPPELANMGFDDIVKTLAANGPRGEQLWAQMKGKPLQLTGKVVSVTPAVKTKTVRFAVGDETKQKPDAFDVELTLAEPLAGKLSVGIEAEFGGFADDFKPSPFVLLMADGKIRSGIETPVKKAPPAAKKGAKKAAKKTG